MALFFCCYSLLTVPFYIFYAGYFGKAPSAYSQQDILYTESMTKYIFFLFVQIAITKLIHYIFLLAIVRMVYLSYREDPAIQI
jgi:hypothetical protein